MTTTTHACVVCGRPYDARRHRADGTPCRLTCRQSCRQTLHRLRQAHDAPLSDSARVALAGVKRALHYHHNAASIDSAGAVQDAVRVCPPWALAQLLTRGPVLATARGVLR